MDKVAKAGPIVLLREQTPEGAVLNFIVLSGGKVLQVFSLRERHLIAHRSAIELLSEFVEDLKEKEGV